MRFFVGRAVKANAGGAAPTGGPPRKLEYLERELRRSPAGAELLTVIQTHAEEVVRLINGRRRVTATWQRNHGPAFIQAIVASGFDEGSMIPKQVNGVTLEALLLRMADALQRDGSLELRREIANQSLLALRWARECDSLRELFGRLESTEREVAW